MINGLTAEEYNAKERLRGSIVAKLHGYTPFDEGDTEEGLKAQFLELTGESYRSQEEEQADNLEAAKERRQLRIEAQSNSDHADHRQRQGQRLHGLPRHSGCARMG